MIHIEQRGIQEMRLLVVVILACVMVPTCVLAQEVGPLPPGTNAHENSQTPELVLGFGLQVDSVFSLLSVQAWFNNALGVEIIGGALIVPSQITIRGLWRALETDITRLYVAPGCTLREDGFSIHATAGTEWTIAENVSLSLEVGLGFVLPGIWLPPGPVPFIGGGLPFYPLMGIGFHFCFPFSLGGETTATIVPPL
jgi:hypothetical protein